MNFKKRVSGSWTNTPHYIHNTSTDTITTLPAVLYPNDTTATAGLKGDMVQSSQPTPDNPVMPQGTGDMTRNLFDESTIEVGGLDPNTGMEVVDRNRRRSGYIAVDSSTYYSIFRQLDETSTSNFWALGYDENKNVITDGSDSSRPGVISTMGTSSSESRFKTTPTTKYIRWYVTTNNSYSNIMLNLGTTALPYEPYGFKLNISSANTTTPVYLGEVSSTRQIKKFVLTGEENFNTDTYLRFSIYISDMKSSASRTGRSYCSHYECLYNAEPYDNNWNNVYYQSGGTLYFHDRRFASVADFKAYLAAQYAAGTPVTVWYVLTTEETGVVNEPLMKIGDYADTLGNISIPVTAGGDTLSVGTTVQPSEVTVNYKGWHPVADVHERDNGAWT